MTFLAAHASTTLRATLSAGTTTVSSVVFEILDTSGQVLAQSGPVAVAERRASWDWTPNTATATTLTDDLDTIVVNPRVRYTFNGDELTRDLPEITVFRDRVNIKVVADVNGQRKDVTDARVRLIVHRPGLLTRRQTLGSVLTNAGGVAEFQGLLHWTSIDVVVKTPWQLVDDASPYTAGHAKGLDREVLVEPKTYLAGFTGIKVSDADDFAAIAELDGVRKQYVNFDAFEPGKDTLYPNEHVSYFGHRIKLAVGPSEDPQTFAGEPIFVKLTANPNNSARNDPAPQLVDADEDGIAELRLGPDGYAVATVELGLAGGDRFKLQVCSAKKFSTVPDQEFEIETWRRLYYELIAPEVMAPMLEQIELHASEGTGPHYALGASLREQIRKTLAPVFIEYLLACSTVFPDAEAVSQSQFVPPTFFGKPAGRTWYIGSTATVDDDPRHPYRRVNAARVGGLRLVDLLCDRHLRSSYQIITTEQAEVTIATPDERSHIVPNTDALRGNQNAALDKQPTLHLLSWRAMIDPADPAYKDHPALKSYKKYFQSLSSDCYEVVAHNRVIVRLPNSTPEQPGSFVGPLSPTTCPIELKFTLNLISLLAGSNMLGRMTTALRARDDHDAFTLCHELGHSMNLGQLDHGGMREPPPGLPRAKHVDEGGNYYTEAGHGDGRRSHGKGPHCASGLADKTITTYPTEPDANVCVMFGYAPSRNNPVSTEPHPFCDQCQLYLKGMDLRDLR